MNIPNFEKCVRYALKMKAIDSESFDNTDLRVYHRRTANPGTVFTALRKGGIVIPFVNASFLGEYKIDISATVVLKANQISDMVSLYFPKSNDIQILPIATFVEAWETAGGECVTAFPPDSKTYVPKLIDLEHIMLPNDISELHETIAENAHDKWAMERQSEGWTYGPKRDDLRLETPDMVPYSQLPESEKEYDRIMAKETLKLLIALGYKIEKNG